MTTKLRAFYTIKELADLSGIRARTIKHWLAIGRIRPQRVGKLVFVSINAIRESQPELWASICTKNALQPSECEACGAPIKP